ncbi:penicillin-binding protein 2 [Paenibacillus sp. sptzw28]|nr:penicillin-binding protein 2 [Paenibacillus sp. sptzw28]
MQDDPQKRETANRRNFSFRLNLFFFAAFVLFSVLIVRLAILQFVEGSSLKEVETKNGSIPVLIPPIRGNIYDSGGNQIAYSTSTQSLYYTIEPGPQKQVIANATALAKELLVVFQKYGSSNEVMTLDEIKKNMDLEHKKNPYSVPRRIKSGLTNHEIAVLMGNRDQFPGTDIVEESIRHYDKTSFAVQLVGYLKRYGGGAENNPLYKNRAKTDDSRLKYLQQEDVGFDGLEYMYQDILRGKNGLKTYPVNAASRIIGPPAITKPDKGDNLYLTINREVQTKTEEAIMDQLRYLQTTPTSARQKNAKTGYAVAMEVKTGKVIAMASMPDYDPNIWEGGRIGNDDYDKIKYVLLNGTIYPVIGPYKTKVEENKHPSSVVFLGSTQKPLSVLIGLNEKLFTTSSAWDDKGIFSYGNGGKYEIKNAQNHAYGTLYPWNAIAHSSNPWMAKMVGDALYHKGGDKGVDIWDKYVKQFGLGVSTGSGLPNESNGVIDYFHEREAASSQSALIRASFGQLGRYTTLQLAQYAATLASHGKRMKPQFVNQIEDSEGHVVSKFKPEVLNTITFPKAYWDEIEKGMANVSVPAFNDAPYKVLRKTGTSEQQVSTGIVDNAVFIAYAPAEDPVLAVAVVVPEGGFGANGAAPIARKIFDAYHQAVGLHGVPQNVIRSVKAVGRT